MDQKHMSILDAFIALEQLNDDDVHLPMNEGKSFKIRNSDDMEKAKEFVEEKQTKDVSLEVIDVDADSLEHLKNNEEYIGQLILQCNSCKANRFINAEDLVESESDKDIYNLEDECPHCHGKNLGFHLIGQVGKVSDDGEVAETTFENDSLTDEPKFENDLESSPEKAQPEEQEAAESDEAETNPESEEGGIETSTAENTEISNEAEAETSESEESESEESESEEDEYAEPLSAVEDEEEKEDSEKAKKESLKEDIEIDAPKVIDVFNSIIEPENIEKIFIYDLDTEYSEEEIFKGSFDEIPQELLKAEVVDFAVGSGMLILNIDSEAEVGETTPTVKDALKLFGDDFNSQISIWDQTSGEEVFVGTKQSVLDDYGNYAFIAFEAPEILQLNTRGSKVEEALKTEYSEELDLANKEDKLIADILKANDLKAYNVDKYGSDEYWIADSIRNLEDLDVIFSNYVEGKGDKLVLDFKDVTGFKEAIDETCLEEEIQIDDDKLAEEAKKLLLQNDAFACIYGYQKNGKTYGLKEKFIICKDKDQLSDKSEIVRLRYKPTGSIKVAYAANAFEEFDYRNRKDLSKAILECEENNINYTVKRSKKENYRYTLITESPDRGFFAPVEAPTEVVDELPQEDHTEESTALADPRDVELVDKLRRISHDTAIAIQDYYGVQADERAILADMIRDLRLISGELSPDELEDTPINNLTREMYAAYNGFYEALDELTSFITGQPITTTTAQKLTQALASLDSESFETETIRERIQDPEFLAALQHGAVPGIMYHGNPRNIRLLNAPEETDESISEDKECEKTFIITTDDGMVFEIQACSEEEARKEFEAAGYAETGWENVRVKQHIKDIKIKEAKVTLDIQYVVSLFGDSSHYYVEDDENAVAPDIKSATKFQHKKDINIDKIVSDIIRTESKVMPEADVAGLFDCNTLEEVEEKDENYFLESGLVEIVPVYEDHTIDILLDRNSVRAKSLKLDEAKEDDDWKELLTFEEVKEFGKDSKWDVAQADGEKYFKLYTKDGTIFVGKGKGKNRILALKKPDGTISNAFDINDVEVKLTESLEEATSSQAYDRWERIQSELDKRGIKYNLDLNPNQVFEDYCEELITINHTCAFGLFKNGSDYSICIGDDLVEAPKGMRVEKLVDKVLKDLPESLKEEKKDDELPADPEVVKADVHNTIATLVKDEVEAIDGYEEAKAEIADTHIEHKDEIIDTLDHIEDEEKEHVDELVDAASDIKFDKEEEGETEELEAEKPAEEEPEEVDSTDEVGFDEAKFENFINEWFDNNIEETKLFECLNGGIKEDGTIVLEGTLHSEEGKEEAASFTLTPNKAVNEDLLDSNKITTYTISCDYFPEGLVVTYNK